MIDPKSKIFNNSEGSKSNDEVTIPNTMDNPQKHIKKKNKEKTYRYGNYDRYYGYRNNNKEFTDQRIELFKERADIFNNQDILDIGCNNGFVSIEILKHFHVKSLTGIDIDRKLIGQAKSNLNNLLKNYDTNVNNNKINDIKTNINTLKNNINFIHGNYLIDNELLLDLEVEKYDVILFLSISKWIHLNYGDNGLILTFKRIYKQLRKGGVFIIEPQLWSTYKKRKNINADILNNYKMIKLKPDMFKEYLLNTIGFTSHYSLDTIKHQNKGFRRPIEVYTK